MTTIRVNVATTREIKFPLSNEQLDYIGNKNNLLELTHKIEQHGTINLDD